MAKIDLHVHSKYSSHPSEWFLQKIGTRESYSEPDFIYESCIERGMDYVTITDHNTIEGALYLKEKYPDTVFTGVEATAYFPEDGGKVHILIYDITREQFQVIQEIRKDIYLLRNYIKSNNLVYSVAHATYSVNGTLKVEHLEKLILLFDIFEVINGGRNERNNRQWFEFLKNLTKKDIEKLKEKHKLNTFSDEAWIKGFTGGSDDHAGIYFGRSYTITSNYGLKESLEEIRDKKSYGEGRYNDYRALAFTIYKIAYDFAKLKGENISKGFVDKMTSFLFDEQKPKLKDRFKIFKLKNDNSKDTKRKELKRLMAELAEGITKNKNIRLEEKLDFVYDKAAEIADKYLVLFADAVEKDLKNGNFYNLVKNISSSLPGIFICIPFLSTFKYLFNNRNIIDLLNHSMRKEKRANGKKILWFTDTINDLNGVSVTLKKIGFKSIDEKKDLKIVFGLKNKEINEEIPQNHINLEIISEFELPYYEEYKIKFPSLLKTLKSVYEFDPDEIYVSTPGSIGILGLFLAKLLNLKCIGVYHTDFTEQSKHITMDSSIMTMVEGYSKWFYSMCDEVKVPTNEYIDILNERGYNIKKFSIFKRAIETERFKAFDKKSSYLKENYEVKRGITLLYTGRVSKDKNLDFLIEVYIKALENYTKLNLVIAGNGPYLEEIKKKCKKYERIYFTGKISYKKMAEIYNSADIFLFPSVTDTFGMSVLEAQACGLPAIVSDIGGPKEIVQDNKTGFVVRATSVSTWVEKINTIIKYIEIAPERYNEMSKESIKMVEEKYVWKRVMDDIFGESDG